MADGWLLSAGIVLLILELIVFLCYEPNIGKLIWMALLAYCSFVCFWKSGYFEEVDSDGIRA